MPRRSPASGGAERRGIGSLPAGRQPAMKTSSRWSWRPGSGSAPTTPR